MPKENNIHKVAQRAAPESRVVYVNRDPIVLAHAHALLRGTPEGVTRYIYGELRESEAILRASAETLDFTRPIAVLLSASCIYSARMTTRPGSSGGSWRRWRPAATSRSPTWRGTWRATR
ncbi:MAG TPA: SAM-dependent methyltransferase [Streptosporangiaceae bacterium]